MPGDYFFLNYGVQDGNVMQGLFRVEKSTLELQVYNGSQWIPVAGGGGGDTSAKAMSTVQRMAFVPASGALIWDTDLERLFVGTSHNAGGVEVGGSNARNLTTAERMEIVPASGELIFDTDEGVLYIGDGFTVGGNAVGSGGGGDVVVHATPIDIMTGSGASKVLDVSNFRGALTAGQAVDVTSRPDGVTGDYRSTFNVTGSLGFASFPKYASGFNYLMIADLTATTSGTVTPSGTWLDGTTAAKNLEGGTSARVAMLFNAANKAKFTFSSTGSVSVTNCREYEVTACSAEAVAYIAQLASPDTFASYYLIKQDMVQPWTAIIDMGSSPAVTIASGLSYKLNATTGTHTLTVDTCPEGYDGRDAIIRIRLGGNGVVQAVAPLQLGGALVPYAINNCVVRFRDGEAVLLVEDTLAGYVVTVTSGTDSGSLAYGLAATGIPYIAFSTSTDGQVVDMGNAVTANEEVTVVGNGYTNTTITGNITCTSKTTVANLGLQDVTVAGGTMTLGDAYIPSGSTVAVSGGGLAIEKVTGAGAESVIDLGYNSATQTGGKHISVSYNTTVTINGCTIINGYDSLRGGAIEMNGNKAVLNLSNCILQENLAGYGGAVYTAYGTINIFSCAISGNTANSTDGVIGAVLGSASVNIVDSYVNDNVGTNDVRINTAGSASLSGSTVGSINAVSGTVSLSGNNKIGYISGTTGSVTLSSGAILDLTGNTNATPIAPGGGITFEAGGATVLVGSGTASSSYMMDNVTLPAGASLTNTNEVKFTGTLTLSAGCAINGIATSGTIINSGTMAACTIESGGDLDVRNGGVASNVQIQPSARMEVKSGGVANKPTINSNGKLTVFSAGSALLVTSNTGAVVVVEDGGYITYKE